MGACNCMGPQNGEPLCPCMMQGMSQWRWRYGQNLYWGARYSDLYWGIRYIDDTISTCSHGRTRDEPCGECERDRRLREEALHARDKAKAKY